MKTISKIALALALVAGQAGVALAQSNGSAATHGAVQVEGQAAKAVVVGPMTIHAFSEFKGGTLYSVKAVTGTDSDCALVDGRMDTTALPADNVQSFTVGAGRVACIAATTDRNVELLWHAQKDAPASNGTTMMARR